MNEKEIVKSRINVLVIGAGGFGRHYARILSQLNGQGIDGIPFIDKLIVTRTRLEDAQQHAKMLRNQETCSAGDIIGAEINNSNQLAGLLDRYEPAFIGIVARDSVLYDEIHAIYTMDALKSGAVLCEKPFSNATGDGSSLRYFDDLSGHENRARFGLELPIAVVMDHIRRDKTLYQMFRNAKRFEFHWETLSTPKGYIINDLALHPWSMIPENYRIEFAEADSRDQMVRIRLGLYDPAEGREATCGITLREGGDFRGMKIDDRSMAVRISGGLIQLVELNDPLEAAVRTGSVSGYGDVLLEVHNPLEQNIIAALRHEPVVNLDRTYKSQLFLEMLHGYNPSARAV